MGREDFPFSKLRPSRPTPKHIFCLHNSGKLFQALQMHRMHHSDRKSTRLNSSHRCISYAVSCLKKNNDAQRPGELYQRLFTLVTDIADFKKAHGTATRGQKMGEVGTNWNAALRMDARRRYITVG